MPKPQTLTQTHKPSSSNHTPQKPKTTDPMPDTIGWNVWEGLQLQLLGHEVLRPKDDQEHRKERSFKATRTDSEM